MRTLLQLLAITFSVALTACSAPQANGTRDDDEQPTEDAGDCSDPTCATLEARRGPACGNGLLERGEQCDDGNRVNGDGCSSTCNLELCGNGIVDLGEQCDDGNRLNGDGCSSTCSIE
jgi:cysteine-rich repeat protein